MRRTAAASYFPGLKAQIEAAMIFNLRMGQKPVLIQNKHKSSVEGTLVHERLHPSRGGMKASRLQVGWSRLPRSCWFFRSYRPRRLLADSRTSSC